MNLIVLCFHSDQTLSSDLDVWGAYSYNKANDVARVKVTVNEGESSVEAFSITFTKGKMHLAWSTVRVEIPISKIK